MFVQNQWYVASWDHEIDRAPFARTICGQPLVFYRKFDRTVVALHDACPHRLLPLSMGIKEGDNIRCRYHGLLLNSEGQAVEMPDRRTRVTRAFAPRLYPVVERHRFVWVWIGDADKADEALIPDFWPCSRPGWTFDGGYLSDPVRLSPGDRQPDGSVPRNLHPSGIHRAAARFCMRRSRPRRRAIASSSSRWMPGIDAPPFWRNALKQDGPVDRWQICHFLPPSSVIIDVGVAPAGRARRSRTTIRVCAAS